MSDQIVIFVLSSQRSGSTWAGYVLGSHTDSEFLGEYYRGWRPELNVPCPFCVAQGLSECTVLHGIDEVPEKEAFSFAFERFGKPVLVDSSKDLDWANYFYNASKPFAVKAVHLIRDPRGFYFSQRRRMAPEIWPALLPDWLRQNLAISEFLREKQIPHTTAFYDDLATKPATAFEPLFRFAGLEPELSALSYWKKPHHAFAANGASHPVLRDLPVRPASFITGDEGFYEERANFFFHDERWKQALLPGEKAAIENDTDISRFLKAKGKRLSSDGLIDT